MKQSDFILRWIVLGTIVFGLTGLACQTSTQYHASKELELYKNNEQHYRRQGQQAQAKGNTEEAVRYFAEAELWRNKYKQGQIRYYDSLYLTPDDYSAEHDLWHERNLDYSDEDKILNTTKTTADTQENRSTQ